MKSLRISTKAMPGSYIKSQYKSDSFNEIKIIRIQPETKEAVLAGVRNSVSDDDVSGLPVSISASGSKRSNRSIARAVTLKFVGSVPMGYSATSEVTIPWLNPYRFNDFGIYTEGTYLGLPVRLVKKRPEKLL